MSMFEWVILGGALIVMFQLHAIEVILEAIWAEVRK